MYSPSAPAATSRSFTGLSVSHARLPLDFLLLPLVLDDLLAPTVSASAIVLRRWDLARTIGSGRICAARASCRGTRGLR